MLDIFSRGVSATLLNKKWIGGWICMHAFMTKQTNDEIMNKLAVNI